MGHLLQARYAATVPGLTDRNSGSRRRVATMFPACPRDWHWVGQRAHPGYDRRLPTRELVFRAHPDADPAVLTGVAEWAQVWGTPQGWAMWRAVAPPGYLVVGDVFHYTYPPDHEETFASYACVRADCALAVPVGSELWNDAGTGGRHNGSMWAVPDSTGNPWQHFRVQAGYDRPAGPAHIVNLAVVEILLGP